MLRGLASRPGSSEAPARSSSLVAGHGHLHGLLEVVCGDGRVAELVQTEESDAEGGGPLGLADHEGYLARARARVRVRVRARVRARVRVRDRARVKGQGSHPRGDLGARRDELACLGLGLGLGARARVRG